MTVVLVAIGLALLAVSWVCWTGRWRGWTGLVLPLAPITALPTVGLLFLAMGLGPLLPAVLEGVLYALTLAALLAAVVVWLWDPRWYGPAWYRERLAPRAGDRLST